MAVIRKPFQGILNIIRFNWHFYVIAFAFVVLALSLLTFAPSLIKTVIYFGVPLLLFTILVSLIVSYYVYDVSGLYQLDWIKNNDDNTLSILNINAGFDETSEILQQKFLNAQMTVLDFYDPERHTEISIKRARKKYPPYPETISIKTNEIELNKNSIDKIFVILSAHEIRNHTERVLFFTELRRILKPEGEIIVIEHLRDLPNFIAYNIGAFHFYSKSSWLHTFSKSNLALVSEIKNTAFISTFILKKNGTTL